MKRRKDVLQVLVPVIMTISLYLVFNSRIESRPNHVGFWFIFIMGVSVGVALTRIIQWSTTKEKDKD
jgi:hypothetical protein